MEYITVKDINDHSREETAGIIAEWADSVSLLLPFQKEIGREYTDINEVSHENRYLFF